MLVQTFIHTDWWNAMVLAEWSNQHGTIAVPARLPQGDCSIQHLKLTEDYAEPEMNWLQLQNNPGETTFKKPVATDGQRSCGTEKRTNKKM